MSQVRALTRYSLSTDRSERSRAHRMMAGSARPMSDAFLSLSSCLFHLLVDDRGGFAWIERMPLVRGPPWREALAPADRGLVGNGALPGFRALQWTYCAMLGASAPRATAPNAPHASRGPRGAMRRRRRRASSSRSARCRAPTARRRRHRGELADIVHNDEHRARARLEERSAVHVEKRPVVGGRQSARRAGRGTQALAEAAQKKCGVGGADGAHYPGRTDGRVPARFRRGTQLSAHRKESPSRCRRRARALRTTLR